jgi:hypothetical protein
MFNWTTTTVINEIPENFIVQPKGKNNETLTDRLRIGKHLFEKRWVESIRKAVHQDVKLCEAKVDLSKVDLGEATVARLYIYVGLEGSEESIYANDWYRKGMPFSVSFAAGEAADMAKAIVDAVKTFNVFTKVKKVLDVTADDNGVLTVKGTHEHQRLNKIAILVEDPKSVLGEEKVIAEYEANRKEHESITISEPGVNGFGTYSQLLKDLRLPTAVHNNWLSVQKDEMPIVGAKYDQYIITYYAPSTSNPSFTAVGNRSMSETTHVFWVKSDLVSAWETALKPLDPDAEGFNTVVVEANKRFNNKKAESIVAGE